MMTETGRVVALDDQAVWVETLRASTCGKCSARQGCGHGLLASMGRSASLVRALRAPHSPGQIQLNDDVSISMPERGFLRGVAVLYLLPLLCMVAAALAVSELAVHDALTRGQADLRVTFGALTGLAAGLLLLRWRTRRDADDPALYPVVTANVTANVSANVTE